MKNKANKILFKISVCVLILVAVVGLGTAFLLNYNRFAPDSIEYIQNDENAFLYVQANTSYKGYRYVFSNAEGEIVVESTQNTLSLEECLEKGIELGGTYKVKYCYLGQTNGNNSLYSKEVEWTCEKSLKAPVISYNAEENCLVWNRVANADYYNVYYNYGELVWVKVTQKVNSQQCKFSLSGVEAGERGFYVVACSNRTYYKSSNLSNIIELDVTRQMEGFTSATFDSTKKVLTLTTKEELSEIMIYIGEKAYKCYTFTRTLSEGIYTYRIDISLIYEDGEKIGAKPLDIDKYTFYKGDVTYVQ